MGKFIAALMIVLGAGLVVHAMVTPGLQMAESMLGGGLVGIGIFFMLIELEVI